MVIEIATICITAIIITVLIIKYNKDKLVSNAAIERMDARYNDLFSKISTLDIDAMQKDYKEIKDSAVVLNQQISSLNSKLNFSNLRTAVTNNGI